MTIAATGTVATITGKAHTAPKPKSPIAGRFGRVMPIADHDSAPLSTTRSRMRPIYTTACSSTDANRPIGASTEMPRKPKSVPAATSRTPLIGMPAANTRNGDGPV